MNLDPNESHVHGPLVIKAFSQLLSEMDQPATECILPTTFLRTMEASIPFINVYTQNDMHETFMILWNRMNEEICVPISMNKPSQDPVNGGVLMKKLQTKCDREWSKMINKEYSPLIDLVYGQQIVQIICGGCKHIHHNYQPFNVLELPVEGTELQDCLNAAFVPEKLNATPEIRKTDGWTCTKCKEIHASEKTVHFWKLPPILIMCLKRFVSHSNGVMKRNTSIRLPKGVSFYPLYQSTPNKPMSYTLKAVGHHVGDLNCGHYYTSSYTNDKWFHINDMHTRESNDIDTNSYMLFFEAI